jgi:hypothetical protein
MSSGTVRLSDLVVPEIFTSYTQTLTEEKSRLIQSGALVRSASLDGHLAGGGSTFNEPFFKDVENDAENTSGDDPAVLSTPNKIGTGTEIQVRLSRNNSWSSMDLNSDLIGVDPMGAIASRVGAYWTRRMQAAFIATMKGVFADNAAAPAGADTHTQNDLTHDVSGGAYSAGVTNFTAEAFIDAALTMGDSMQALGMIFVHSVVFGRMQKNNLIDFIPDSRNPDAESIPTFLGRMVVVDDGMPVTSGVFESWLFGAGAVQLGMGSPKVPTEVERVAAAGNGSGSETLHNRVEWMIHPVGHAYIGTYATGGPTNAATANNLAAAGSWRRVFTERKQIRIARLITREY